MKNEELSTMYGSAQLVKAKGDMEDKNYLDDLSTTGLASDFKIKEQYTTDWENDDWNNVDFKIDKVRVTGANDTVDTTENHVYVSLNYILDNKTDREVILNPERAWVILQNNTKIESSIFSDTWENIFSKHKKKYGHIHFDFGSIKEFENIQGVYMKFSGHFVGVKDDNISHIYEVPLYL